jgi:hypothetical protein
MIGNGVTDAGYDGNAVVNFAYFKSLIPADLFLLVFNECKGVYWKPPVRGSDPHFIPLATSGEVNGPLRLAVKVHAARAVVRHAWDYRDIFKGMSEAGSGLSLVLASIAKVVEV